MIQLRRSFSTLITSFILNLIIILPLFFIGKLWIGWSRFNASESFPGDITTIEKYQYILNFSLLALGVCLIINAIIELCVCVSKGFVIRKNNYIAYISVTFFIELVIFILNYFSLFN
ncbi:hypothetical protein [Paenibacillus alvei]|uniref:Uncharacterized protein n=1 Tax=Paenibacillus alvei TaxID=44250 RepID=A0AAP6ZTH1_PAEAL|nr:hypothetical protein [Paenibacillus alvei]NOJ69903.1 hypothetical protein [Paenibacillus alvei]